MNANQPLVSVPVITYNSSATIIETLDSIYNQTYPNIELIVSDDCSTDGTREICRDWIESHKERFARTKFLTVDKNTGTSGNCNRAEAACNGEWIKGIAGDDLLVEDCIENCVNYVLKNDGVTILFGRQDAFGADENRCRDVNAVFDYEMLQAPVEKQLHTLLFETNYIPATAMFYNRERMRATGVKNDERIPLLEDWPKWINLLKAGVKFHFIDKVLVRYRVGGISTNGRFSSSAYRSDRLFHMYYRFPVWMENNYDDAVKRIVDHEVSAYEDLLVLESKYDSIRQSYAYRIGKKMVAPFSWIKNKIRNK